MPRPIVIAHHLIFTAYGWWLPNDPRGSTSRTICNDVIADLGNLHYGRKKVQPAGWKIRDFYDCAAPVLQHDLREFTGREAREIAHSFRDVINQARLTTWACAIMPDHVHLLIRKHKLLAEEMIAQFQSSSRSRLRALDMGPAIHPVWGGPGWKVFLDHPDEVWRTVKYIEENPTDRRLPRQKWSFVVPYDKWPLHEGHSERSPNVRALKAVGRYP